MSDTSHMQMRGTLIKIDLKLIPTPAPIPLGLVGRLAPGQMPDKTVYGSLQGVAYRTLTSPVAARTRADSGRTAKCAVESNTP